jgi:hypothetical protein
MTLNSSSSSSDNTATDTPTITTTENDDVSKDNESQPPQPDKATNEKEARHHYSYQYIHDLLYGAINVKENHVRAAELLFPDNNNNNETTTDDPVWIALQADVKRHQYRNDPLLWNAAVTKGLLEAAISSTSNEQETESKKFALYYMGILYYMGKSGSTFIAQDLYKAYDCFQQAYRMSGHSSAAFSIGSLYHLKTRNENEIGSFFGMPNYYALQQAKEWYEKAAALGHASACNNLGMLYRNNPWLTGKNTNQKATSNNNKTNKKETKEEDKEHLVIAKMWYEKAAAQGNHYALYNLGVYYEKTLKNKELAHRYYTQAAEKGNRLAIQSLQSFEASQKRNFSLFRGMFTQKSMKQEETKAFLM